MIREVVEDVEVIEAVEVVEDVEDVEVIGVVEDVEDVEDVEVIGVVEDVEVIEAVEVIEDSAALLYKPCSKVDTDLRKSIHDMTNEELSRLFPIILTDYVYIRYPGDWDEIRFRDYLVKNKEIAKEYESLMLTREEIFEQQGGLYQFKKRMDWED